MALDHVSLFWTSKFGILILNLWLGWPIGLVVECGVSFDPWCLTLWPNESWKYFMRIITALVAHLLSPHKIHDPTSSKKKRNYYLAFDHRLSWRHELICHLCCTLTVFLSITLLLGNLVISIRKVGNFSSLTLIIWHNHAYKLPTSFFPLQIFGLWILLIVGMYSLTNRA